MALLASGLRAQKIQHGSFRMGASFGDGVSFGVGFSMAFGSFRNERTPSKGPGKLPFFVRQKPVKTGSPKPQEPKEP